MVLVSDSGGEALLIDVDGLVVVLSDFLDWQKLHKVVETPSLK